MTRPVFSFPFPVIIIIGLTLAISTYFSTIYAADSDDEQRLYQIELIIFENTASSDTSELWNIDPGVPDMADSIELQRHDPAPDNVLPKENISNDVIIDSTNNASTFPLSAPDAPIPTSADNYPPYTLLPDTLLRLNTDLTRLKTSRDFQPLLHIGWRQHVPEQNDPQVIQIDSRKLLLYTARISGEEDTANESVSIDDTTNTDIQDPQKPLYTQGPDEIVTHLNENFVSGTLTLSRGRYLHMNLDILYQRQSNTPMLFTFFGFGNTSDTPEKFRMLQKRRMKRDEINYFDHPKFGVLAIITAVEATEEEDQVKTIPLKVLR